MKRLALLVLAALAATLVLAGPASAHVTVSSTNATQGGYGVLTFRVPTESDTASTTKLEVKLPADHPIASVSVQPLPGWRYQVTETKLASPVTTDDGDQITDAVSSITWTATGDGIKPGEFEQFQISVGPLPEVDSLAFPTLQTYSDQKVVAWNEVAAPGSSTEPEHPAPSLALTAATGGDHHGAATTTAKDDSSNAGPYALSIVALALAAAALGLTVIGRAKARKES